MNPRWKTIRETILSKIYNDDLSRKQAMLAVVTPADAVETREFEGRVYDAYPSDMLPKTNCCNYCAFRERPCYDFDFTCHSDSRPDGLNVVFAERS